MRPQILARLEGLAQVWLGLNQPERAGTLLGAASRLRAAMGAPVLPVDRPGYDQTLGALRASLGDGALAAAWAAGEAISTDESVAYALGAGR